MRIARAKRIVVFLQLCAFLLVQADFPISQAAAIRPAVTAGKCAPRQCCCSLERRDHGTCCCSSKPPQAKSFFALRASPCGENGPDSGTVIVVKFQVVLPVL